MSPLSTILFVAGPAQAGVSSNFLTRWKPFSLSLEERAGVRTSFLTRWKPFSLSSEERAGVRTSFLISAQR